MKLFKHTHTLSHMHTHKNLSLLTGFYSLYVVKLGGAATREQLVKWRTSMAPGAIAKLKAKDTDKIKETDTKAKDGDKTYVMNV